MIIHNHLQNHLKNKLNILARQIFFNERKVDILLQKSLIPIAFPSVFLINKNSKFVKYLKFFVNVSKPSSVIGTL